jgi:hypothetical protein
MRATAFLDLQLLSTACKLRDFAFAGMLRIVTRTCAPVLPAVRPWLGTAGIGWPTPWVKIKINFNGGGQECPPYTFFGVPLDK